MAAPPVVCEVVDMPIYEQVEESRLHYARGEGVPRME